MLKTQEIQKECSQAAVCQYKPSHSFARQIATIATKPSYVVAGQWLCLMSGHFNWFYLQMKVWRYDFHLRVHVEDTNRRRHTLFFDLNVLLFSQYLLWVFFVSSSFALSDGIGSPQFLYESTDCGYFFIWYTSSMCPVKWVLLSSSTSSSSPTSSHNSTTRSSTSSGSASAVYVLLISIFCLLLLFFIILAVRKPRLRNRIRRVLCCPEQVQSGYYYLRVSFCVLHLSGCCKIDL